MLIKFGFQFLYFWVFTFSQYQITSPNLCFLCKKNMIKKCSFRFCFFFRRQFRMSPELFDHLLALVKPLIKKKDTNLWKSISADFKKNFKKIFKNTWERVQFLVKLRGYSIYFTGIEFLRICSYQIASWKRSRNSILTVEL